MKKNKMKTISAAAWALLGLAALSTPARAADERAKRDINDEPVAMGIDSASGEIRQFRTDSNGNILISSSSSIGVSGSTVTADQGAAGSEEWKVVASSDSSSIAAAQAGTWNVGLNAGTNQIGTVTGSTVAVHNAEGTSLSVDDGAGSLTVDATDLDVRDLSRSQDSVAVDGSTVAVVNASGGSLTVGSTDLDIRDLSRTQDSVSVDGSTVAVVNASGGSLTVAATDLDIRDLTSASDSVEVLQAAHDSLNANANLQVGNADVANGNPVPVSDAAGSLTVDGTVTADQGAAGSAEWLVKQSSASSSVQASQLGSWTVTADAGSGIYDTTGSTVAVHNAEGTSLSVDDNAGSLTVDSMDLDIRDLSSGQDSVAAVQSGAWTVTANAGTGDFSVNGSTLAVTNPDGENLNVSVQGTATVAAAGFSAPVFSTHSVAGSAIQVLPTDSSRKAALVCNEGPDAARVGPSGVTSAIGQRLLADECFSPDGPLEPHQAALWAISTTGSAVKITTYEAR